MSVAYTSPDLASTERVFNQLSEGGEVQMPLSPTFFSPSFGGCIDRFGVSWLIDTDVAS